MAPAVSRVNKVVCPACAKPLRSARGLRVGRTVPCPHCGAFFTVPEGGVPGDLDGGRLVLAVFGVLLYLAGGAALGYYCFTLNARAQQASLPDPLPAPQNGDDESESPAPPPATQPTVTVDPAQELKIDDAIVKGVWYLKDHQKDDGSWGEALPDGQGVLVGYTALPALALLECGVPADDKQIVEAASLVREKAPTLAPPQPYVTYQLALALLFLDRLGDPKDKDLIQLLALRLAAGQRADDGAWGYECPPLDRKAVPELLKQLSDPKVSLDQWRQAALKGQGFDPGRSDNSNTQFAVLALWVAGRYDVPIERIMVQVEQHFRTTQLPAGPDPAGHMLNLEGAWPYNPESGTSSSNWPTMTASGLLGLAAAHGATTDPARQKQNLLDDPAVKGGLAMLAREIDRPDEKAANRALDLYFLWSVERVAVLYGLDQIGDKDWYGWGSKNLLPMQQKDGNWQAGAYYDNNAIHDTCFALLFLKQANLAQDLTKLLLLGRK